MRGAFAEHQRLQAVAQEAFAYAYSLWEVERDTTPL